MYSSRVFRLREVAARVELASRGRRAGMDFKWCKVLVIRFRQRVSLDPAHKEIRQSLCSNLQGVDLLTILLIFELKILKYLRKISMLKT